MPSRSLQGCIHDVFVKIFPKVDYQRLCAYKHALFLVIFGIVFCQTRRKSIHGGLCSTSMSHTI